MVFYSFIKVVYLKQKQIYINTYVDIFWHTKFLQ